MIFEGKLKLNDCGRFEVEDFQITSGSRLEIQINGVWPIGSIEHAFGANYWFSQKEGISVPLRNAMNARVVLK